MRLFRVGSDGDFTEYEQLPFEVDHQESVLEQWLVSNPDKILEDGRILILGRQVRTDLGGLIDLLGVDREGNVVVVELKRDRTPRDVLAQALEYAAFAARLDVDTLECILRRHEQDESLSLADCHRDCFSVDPSEAVAFNQDQRIVVVGQQVTPAIRQTASFLGSKGVRVTCVEFAFFKAAEGGRLLSQETVVGVGDVKPRHVASKPPPVVSEGDFLKKCDEHGKRVFSRILELARSRSMSVRIRDTSFTVGVEVNGARVVVCYCYPPSSGNKQTLYTALADGYGIAGKTSAPPEAINRLRTAADATRLFMPAGSELKCPIDRAFTDDQVDALAGWCGAVAQAVVEYGPKATGDVHGVKEG